MKVLDAPFLKAYVDMADHGDQLGWHERNGGNFTYWLTKEEAESIQENLSYEDPWKDIGTEVPYLANEYFLISGTGRYFHNMKKDPANTAGIIQLDEVGKRYRICWGLTENGRPTSELPTHLMNMEVKARMTNNQNRVIYHCHCPNIIALTFILPFKSEIFTRELWEMMTECPIIFPQGLGVVEWMVPGGREIAIVTSKLMEQYDAIIWAHHGMFVSGMDFDSTFGLMHTIEKSAEMWIKVHSCVSKKQQTISVEGFKELAKAFNVSLDERFLYEK
ncbi:MULTISPECIES: rhamnulose-1-phosphate aldolase [unclassified Amedibacterium]|uniref:rhamnulose-1-phosphate aldolase n=1 Tax=unclassified Amedibacterium TaxID=3088137 RepID=UPI000E3F59AE|nr:MULTISPECIES: rhamnulose-1-phosphate aldolase [unclassified Absiella]RGB69154.1 rhamnulose-1-phosphate aldolase [Absiella sp. AM09-45]RGB79136.1 rhamnulose-1-phosphate aldolase [Absiella sp. AM09-50]